MDLSDCVKLAVDFFSYAGAVFQKRHARTLRVYRRKSIEASKLGQQVNTLKQALDARETAGKNKHNIK